MSKRTRRQFLEDSMLAAAAAVAAGPVTCALAKEEKASTSPNERLGVALVGAGGRGKEHIRQFTYRPDTEIIYVVDPDESVGHARAEEIAKKQNGRRPKFVQDMRKAFEDPAVDIVSIATPNHWHALAAIWAIQHGKDVYVEKPVSHNVSEGRRIVEAARKYSKICQAGTQSRSMPGMQEAIAYVQKGNIGKLSVGRGLCYKRRKSIGAKGVYAIPANVNYDLWLGPAPEAPLTRPHLHYDWHWQWAYGNGDLGNQGIHQMDLVRWGLGINTLSNAVVSYGGRLGYEDAGETANTQIVMHDFGDKSLVFEVRGLPTKMYKTVNVGIIFEGSDGYLAMTSYDGGAAFDKQGKLVKAFKGGDEFGHVANFIAAVRNRKHETLRADILEGHLSSALCHLANISYRLGKELPAAAVKEQLQGAHTNDKVQDTFDRTMTHLADNGINLDKVKLRYGQTLNVDPAREAFVGNPAADALLTREYRAPFVVPPTAQL